jgi:hypothetical protein
MLLYRATMDLKKGWRYEIVSKMTFESFPLSNTSLKVVFEQADMIVSATVSRGNIHYLVKWKNVDEATLLPSTEVCAKCPNLVIKFFEERMYYLSNCEHDRESSNLRME